MSGWRARKRSGLSRRQRDDDAREPAPINRGINVCHATLFDTARGRVYSLLRPHVFRELFCSGFNIKKGRHVTRFEPLRYRSLALGRCNFAGGAEKRATIKNKEYSASYISMTKINYFVARIQLIYAEAKDEPSLSLSLSERLN